MSDLRPPAAYQHDTDVPAPNAKHSPLTRRAWWAFAALPVSLITAIVLGGWLISLQGHDPDAEDDLPLRVALVAGVPATLVLIAPALAAMLFGRHAMQRGEPAGRTPMIVGAVLAVLLVVQGIAALDAW